MTFEVGARCMECGQSGLDPGGFHPHLYCVLYAQGITDQAAYLKASGWVYQPEHSDGHAPHAGPFATGGNVTHIDGDADA